MSSAKEANFYLSGILTVVGLMFFAGAQVAAWFHDPQFMIATNLISLSVLVAAEALTKE